MSKREQRKVGGFGASVRYVTYVYGPITPDNQRVGYIWETTISAGCAISIFDSACKPTDRQLRRFIKLTKELGA